MDRLHQIGRSAAAWRLTRRGVLRRMGDGGLLAAAGTFGSAARAGAQATPATLAAPELLQEWAVGWSSVGNPDRLLALVTADVVYEDVAVGDVVRGMDQFRALLADAAKAIPDFWIELLTGLASDTTAAAEYVITGTQTGPLPYLAATGKSFRLRASSIFQLQGGKIRRESRYYNMVEFLTQLGALSPSALPALGTPPAVPGGSASAAQNDQRSS